MYCTVDSQCLYVSPQIAEYISAIHYYNKDLDRIRGQRSIIMAKDGDTNTGLLLTVPK